MDRRHATPSAPRRGTTSSAHAPSRRWVAGGVCVWALLLVALRGSPCAAAELRCQVEAGEVVCDVDVRSFMGADIRRALDNGWENMVLFRLYLYDEAEEVAVFSYAELHQRCYVDPFDAYCLAIWEGADDYERFADVDGLIEGVGRFRLRSARALELAPGPYRARLIADLNPITDDQINVVRSWLARNRGGHLVVGSGDASMFGTFVSFFANITPGSAEATLTLDAPKLWVTHPPPTPPDEVTP